jgi:hypothetical protein
LYQVIDLGGNVEKAASMKLVGNSFILGGELDPIRNAQILG